MQKAEDDSAWQVASKQAAAFEEANKFDAAIVALNRYINSHSNREGRHQKEAEAYIERLSVKEDDAAWQSASKPASTFEQKREFESAITAQQGYVNSHSIPDVAMLMVRFESLSSECQGKYVPQAMAWMQELRKRAVGTFKPG